MAILLDLHEDQFADMFQPVRNHINAHASFDWGQGFGTLFETYGEEHRFVQSHQPSYIWTLLSTDEGDVIVSGYHFVNRVGYFVATYPVPHGVEFQVDLEVA